MKSAEFQTRQRQSGLSEFAYATKVQAYFNKQLRMGVSENDLKYPELDMIVGANSTSYLEEQIKLKNDGASIQNILEYTKTENVEQAMVVINDKHRDLEVTITPLNREAIVQIEHRPTDNVRLDNPRVDISKDKGALIPIFDKLATLYGVKINNVTLADIQSDKKFEGVVDAQHTNAFILDGDIYINMDVADVDAPIHEMSHMLLGSLKYQNRELYTQLIGIAEQLPNYQELAKNYASRTRSDINEEIFVTEFAKFVANKESVIQQLPEHIQENILYNIKRMLDSMLMGDVSVKAIPTELLLQMSMVEIAEMVNSPSFSANSRGTLSNGGIHRILNNRKSDLMNNNELKEDCQ